MRSGARAFLAVVGLIGPLLAGQPALPDASPNPDETALKQAGEAIDGPGLLAFFRKRTLAEDVRRDLERSIQDLGDDRFEVREKATERLIALGAPAVPALLRAEKSSDPETVSRAKKCLERIPVRNNPSLVAAAGRLLAIQQQPGSVETLLAYLPSAGDEWLEEELAAIVADLGVRDGKPDPAVLAAVQHPSPACRIAAARCLARAAETEYRSIARRLLDDANPRVRLVSGLSLLGVQDKTAVPPLIALLTDGPPAVAWQAEDLLSRVAGEQTPAIALDTRDPASRRACRAAWEAWWKANDPRFSLPRIDFEDRQLGLTVVCDCSVGGEATAGRLWEFGTDGKVRWQFDGVRNPADVQVLPNGNLLVAECQGFQVSERDRAGKEIWAHRVRGYPVSCQRLANGNTFIATYSELLEVTREGKPLYSHTKPGSIFCAQKLRTGNILYVHSNGQIVEMEPSGKQVRTISAGNTSSWGGVEVLPGGRFLVAQYAANEVVEIDAEGKELWRCSVKTPAWATRLRNGNTLVASPDARCLFEFDRSGKEVWKKETQGRPFRVRRR
jgi:HEAT repeat protein